VLKTLHIGGRDEAVRLFGPKDGFLKRLRDAFGVEMTFRGEELRVDGPEEVLARCEAALKAMGDEVRRGRTLTAARVEQIIGAQQAGQAPKGGGPAELLGWTGVKPWTPGQESYIRAMLGSDVVFCIGPAGTGKTYLGVAVALSFLKQGRINRIILCRPAVEAGESLGFLPGDIYAKVNPYLRPLYDALHDLMDVRRVKRYIDNDIIEILPLAFVRGRTLDNAFIILDEAQNCSVSQMKTFLTRLGRRARLLVTGDITQNDLPADVQSGMADALERLRGLRGVQFVRLTKRDIVRHPIVAKILEAYEKQLPAAPQPEDAPNA